MKRREGRKGREGMGGKERVLPMQCMLVHCGIIFPIVVF